LSLFGLSFGIFFDFIGYGFVVIRCECGVDFGNFVVVVFEEVDEMFGLLDEFFCEVFVVGVLS